MISPVAKSILSIASREVHTKEKYVNESFKGLMTHYGYQQLENPVGSVGWPTHLDFWLLLLLERHNRQYHTSSSSVEPIKA